MKSTTVNINGEKLRVSAHDVLGAMKKYNHEFRIKKNDSGSKYAVVDGVGKSYPPKRILSLAVKRPRTFFNGGQFTNRVFKDLGFAIRQINSLNVSGDKRSELEPNLDADVPKIDMLVKAILKEKWTILMAPRSPTPQWSSVKDTKHAGVYVLAYSRLSLAGRRIKAGDVDYVGMTHAGLKFRLKQLCTDIAHIDPADGQSVSPLT